MKKLLLLLLLLAATFYTKAQNVGIGTTTPQFPLSFPSVPGDKISLWSDGSATHYGFGIQGGLLQIFAKNNVDDIAFGYGSSTSFTENMRLKGNGNVGIGITDPQHPLDINGRMRLSGTNPYDPGIWLNDAGIDRAFIGLENDDHVGFYGGNGGVGWGFTMNTITGALYINGNVGIGTTNPTTKLHVSAGDASLALFGPNAAGGKLYVGASGNLGVASTAQVIASDGNLHIDPAPAKNIYIGYFQPRDVYINPIGGNVGIGTTTPSASLEVNGYTKLGSNAPAIKYKKLTGTTAATEGGYVSIAHGLTASQILSVSVLVTSSSGESTPANYPQFGFNFNWFISLSEIRVFNASGQSVNILSKPIRILITYEE